MAEKVFQDYQGPVIEINGVCYYYTGETTESVNSDPSEIGGVYDNCLLCNINSSSSSFGYSSSSSQSFACPGDEPDIIVSVSGVSGTINWCGQTWDLPSQSGQTRTICPTQYIYNAASPTTGSHFWRYNGQSLRLDRYYKVTSTGSNGTTTLYGWSMDDEIFLNVNGTVYRDRHLFERTGMPLSSTPALRPFAPTQTSTPNNQVGLLQDLTVNDIGRYSTMKMVDKFFGSFTDGAGITYTWSRGNNWPN